MATRSLRPLTLGGQPLTVDRARRMRWTATGMLAAMALIFIATHGLAATGHPHGPISMPSQKPRWWAGWRTGSR